MRQDESVNLSLGNQHGGNDGFPEGSCSCKNTTVMLQHCLHGQLLVPPQYPVEGDLDVSSSISLVGPFDLDTGFPEQRFEIYIAPSRQTKILRRYLQRKK